MSTTDRVGAGFWQACYRLASSMGCGGRWRTEVLPLPLADEPPDGRPPFVDTVAGWHAV